MLKHKEIIEQLTAAQKIALLTDAHGHAEEQLAAMELPLLSVAELWAGNATDTAEQVYPSAKALANSWNAKLFADVAEHLAARGSQRGTNLFLMPESKAACSIYGNALSEEPRLTGNLVHAAVHALGQAGAAVCVNAPIPTPEDVALLNHEVDMRTLYDRMASPLERAIGGEQCPAVLMPEQRAAGHYATVGDVMMKNTVPAAAMQICMGIEHEQTAAALLENKLLLGGSAQALETALDNYNRIRRSAEEGGATIDELNAAVSDGAAISEEMLDAALDRRLELGTFCNTMMARGGAGQRGFAAPTQTSNERKAAWQESMAQGLAASARQAARESIVMLKNNKQTLPLRPKTKIALIGDIIAENEESAFVGFRDKFYDAIGAGRCSCVGFAQGYHLERERSEELIPAAVSLAQGADVVLVFLGMGGRREAHLHETRRLQLPANQLALFDALAHTGKKLVAVVAGSRLPAMAFDARAQATLLIPGEGMEVAAALAEILIGRYNPTGRLAFAGYNDPDGDFRDIQRRKRAGQRKTGPFIGYRYTCSEGLDVKYPFGYGMSYSKFAYSGLSLTGGGARLTVHNQGTVAGCETVQIYVGKSDSAILRPKMELKGMTRVCLKPGEKRTVDVAFENLGVYDPQSGRTVTEGGAYQVYAAASAGQVRLIGKMTVSGEKLPRQRYKLSEYLHAASNIRSERYTMEASCTPMKKRSILQTVGILLIVLTLLADVIYAMCGLLIDFSFADHLAPFLIVNLVCLVAGIILLVCHTKLRQKALLLQEQKEREATAAFFRDVERVNVSAVEELFVEEFDVPEEAARKEVAKYSDEDEGLYAYMAVDTDLPTVCAELTRFFEERGVALSAELARTVVASVMTSRLLVIRSEDRGMFEKFAALLSEFFGTESYLDVMAAHGEEPTGLLRVKGWGNQAQETNLLHAMYAAQNQRNKAYFAALSEVRLATTGELLMPYIRYFSNPQSVCHVTEGDLSVAIPSNLWFLLGAASGESVDDMPAFVSNFAAVIDLTAEWCQESAERSYPAALGCPQMEALVYRSKKAAVIDEELWKSVDRLEAFVNERTPYHLGNKLCLQLERYLAVYMGCGGELTRAMDSAVAAKLLPAILTNLKGNAAMAEVDFLQTLETIFGEENVMQCRYMLKHITVYLKDEQSNDIDKGAAPEFPEPVVPLYTSEPIVMAEPAVQEEPAAIVEPEVAYVVMAAPEVEPVVTAESETAVEPVFEVETLEVNAAENAQGEQSDAE